MYLDYKKINSGQKAQPMLRLRTLAGKELGPVPFVYNLKFCINYSEVSTIEFTTPFEVNGMLNPLYAALSSYKVLYTENFGIYVLESPTKSGDGVAETKEVKGYSLERLFRTKNLFLKEGTYNFWNPVDSKDTILGRVIELDPSWQVGYVAPRLIGCYRTFDQFDSDALSFCYGDAMEKYRCAFVFDVYNKSINVYDAAEDAGKLPIYLSYDNLVNTVGVDELSDDIATKVHLSGSDGLTIRDVNPTGKDYIVNLDYFLHNRDLDIVAPGSSKSLADRVREWEAEVSAKQTYYTGLVSARASLTAQKLSADVDLTKLKGDLDTLTAQQSIIIQSMAMETTAEGKAAQQAKLDDVNGKIDAKKAEISAQEEKVKSLNAQIEDYMKALASINQELSYEGYFSEEEKKLLNPYLIEANIADETFVATDVDTSVSGTVDTISGEISISDSKLTKVDLTDFKKSMYLIDGGALAVTGANIKAAVMRGTLEVQEGNYVFTAYLGNTEYRDHKFPTGLITVAGVLSDLQNDISEHIDNGVKEYKGTRLSFKTSDAAAHFTVSVSEYQKYTVAMELYDFGAEILNDCAWPVYEFSVDSANFLYHEKFEPFKDNLDLGKSVHLDLGSEGLISAKLIGFELDFEDISNFSLIFSNRYQRRNGMESWLDDVKTASRASRSINTNRYTYNRAADKVTEVSEIMQQQMVAAVNNIVNKEDQTVLINSSGINIGGNSRYQMRLVDNMIAMTDDGWKTAKLAIGLFATQDVGTQWGVNAEMLAGNVLIGNKLILQNPSDDGYMMFQVDETGAWLYNSRFVLQDGNSGGLIIVDPKYGIVAGTKLLFDTNGTTVTPKFMDGAGEITFDSDGMPTNANFYLDVSDGSAYFRGKLVAKSGRIGGFSIEDSYLHSGAQQNYVALNGGTAVHSEYAIWAGYSDPTSSLCPFYVKKDGSLYAKKGTFGGKLEAATGSFSGSLTAVSGTFTGTLSAAHISGDLSANSGAALVGCAIYVPNKVSPKFSVDSAGNVSMLGNLTLSNGAIKWNNLAFSIQNKVEGAYAAASDASDAATAAAEVAEDIANGRFSGGTFIDGTSIYSPTIYANEFRVVPNDNTNSVGGYALYGYYGNRLMEMLRIGYYAGDAPYVNFGSGCGGYANWNFGATYFSGMVDFTNANVTGFSARFG